MIINNSVILITGGARVGQAIAAKLAAANAQLAMTYRRSLSEIHPQAKGYSADLTKEEEIHKLMTALIHDFGRIDALVNMVSVFKPDVEQTTFASFQETFAVNAFGNMLVSRLFAEHAKERKARNAPIVSFIDWAVDHPYERHDTYIAAKAALRHYLMALQSSFRTIIRVVNIHPGMILEPPDFRAAEKEAIIKNTPTGSIGTPEQAATLVKTALEVDFLADDIYLAGGQQWRHRFEP